MASPKIKTPGQIAYEEDVARRPRYHTNEVRPSWSALSSIAQYSWERNPTPRNWPTQSTEVAARVASC